LEGGVSLETKMYFFDENLLKKLFSYALKTTKVVKA